MLTAPALVKVDLYDLGQHNSISEAKDQNLAKKLDEQVVILLMLVNENNGFESIPRLATIFIWLSNVVDTQNQGTSLGFLDTREPVCPVKQVTQNWCHQPLWLNQLHCG